MSLFLLSVETGEKRRLTLPPNEYDDVDPAFSLDGRHLAFARYSDEEEPRAISTSSTFLQILQPQGSPERLTFYNRHLASPVWTSDGRSILFTRSELAGNHSIWRINLSGARKSEPVPLSVDSSTALDVSRRGNRLVYTREISNINVWAVDLPPPKGRSSRSSNPRPWISSTLRGRQSSVFSRWPAGRISIRQLPGQVKSGYVTVMAPMLDSLPIWERSSVVSRAGRQTGRTLSFIRGRTALPAYTSSVLKAVPRIVLTQERRIIGDPVGRTTANGSTSRSRETGDFQVWKMPASGGPAIQVTKRGGSVPLESVDGQYLYYVKLSQNALWRLPLAGGEEIAGTASRSSVRVRLCAWEAGDLFHKARRTGKRTRAGVSALRQPARLHRSSQFLAR